MKLQRAKGTRDYLPEEEIIREEILSIIKKIFEKYGFSPIETPIIERYDILSAKFAAGEESDVMGEIFAFTDRGKRKLGLRYEFTFALARLIGMNPQIKMPFKRYQLGKIFRDGPIKLGRLREFWQCDVDIVGVKDLIADAEIISITKEVFTELKLNTIIKVSSRKLLKNVLDSVGINKEKQDSIIVTIDKLDKLGKNEVIKELSSKKLTKEQINKIIKIITTNDLSKIKKEMGDSDGIKELEELFSLLDKYKIDFEFNPSLARGLTYYTGPIYEVYLKNSEVTSSVAGGGRWDEMIGNYLGTTKEYPATGIAFGLEPIMEEIKKKIKKTKKTTTKVYIIPIKTRDKSINILQELRKNNINTDIDLLDRSISKNLDYANKLKIPYVIFIGEKELAKNKVKLRNMESGKEELLTLKSLIKKLIK